MELHTSIATLTLLSGTIIPFLVGFITKREASPTIKFVTNAVFSAVAGVVLAAVAAGGTIIVHDALVNAATAFAVSLAAYHGAWKPLGVAAKFVNLLPDFGIGGPALKDAWNKPLSPLAPVPVEAVVPAVDPGPVVVTPTPSLTGDPIAAASAEPAPAAAEPDTTATPGA